MSDSEQSELGTGSESWSDSSEDHPGDDDQNEDEGEEEQEEEEEEAEGIPAAKRVKIDLQRQLEIGQYALATKNVSKAGRDHKVSRKFAQRCVKKVPALQDMAAKGIFFY